MIATTLCTFFMALSAVFALSDVRFKYYETEMVGNKCRFNKNTYVKNDEGIYDTNICKLYTCHILDNRAFMEHATCKPPKGFREGCKVEEKSGRFPYCCFNRKMSCPPPLSINDKLQMDDVNSFKGSNGNDNNDGGLKRGKKTENCPCLS